MIAQLLQRRPIERHSASLSLMQLLGTVLDPLQCYANLLLIDAIHVWNQPGNRVSMTDDGSRLQSAAKAVGKNQRPSIARFVRNPRTRRPRLHNSGLDICGVRLLFHHCVDGRVKLVVVFDLDVRLAGIAAAYDVDRRSVVELDRLSQVAVGIDLGRELTAGIDHER
jgi:hypothetical protein